MKTIIVVVLYAAIVGALNLGGAVWDSFHATHGDKAVLTSETHAQKLQR